MKKTFTLLSVLCFLSVLNLNAGRKARHVIVIGVDGLAAESIRMAPAGDLPNIHFLMDHGSWTLGKRSVMPSASAINWASMFNGLPTEMHGFYNWNSLRGVIPSTSDNGRGIPPTIFDLVRDQHPKAETGCVYDWDCIGPLADTTVMDYHKFIKTYQGEEVLITPEDYTKLAVDYIIGKKPELFVFYFGFIDNVGHNSGWYSPEYMQAQRDLDKGIGLIIQAIRDAGILDDTVIILTSDHGGTGKGHGGFTLLELETPFALYGKKIRQGFEIPVPVMQYDTAAIIADLLGIKIPADWRGRPVKQIYR